MRFAAGVLLGAIGGVAAASAEAADLPSRRAAPVEYVRICNVGGMAGWTVPGTDVCAKISGFITAHTAAGNLRQGYAWAASPGAATVVAGPPTSTRNALGWTVRADVNFDVRQDTAFGPLRGYAELHFDNSNGFDNIGNVSNINRAYLQWAGVTAGRADSFFSFFDGGPAWGNLFSPDQRGLNQPDLFAYTMKFTGGFSWTLALQSPGPNADNWPGTRLPLSGNTTLLGMQAPDAVAAFRIDQNWGSAQLSGVAHQVRATDGTFDQNIWGWGLLSGVKFELPSLGSGDNLQLDAVWTRNAIWFSGVRDAMWGESGAPNGNGLPMVVADDWSNGDGSWATPTAWSIAGFYEHQFSPEFSFAPEASFLHLHWGGVKGASIPADANSLIVGGVAHWEPVGQRIDFAVELLYQRTQQSTPVGAVLAAPVAVFPNNTDGFESRFYVTRNF
jgi:hypothetical protein